jgi:hypothetical protein
MSITAGRDTKIRALRHDLDNTHEQLITLITEATGSEHIRNEDEATGLKVAAEVCAAEGPVAGGSPLDLLSMV